MPRRIPKSKKHKKLKSVDPDFKRKIEKKRNAVNLPPNEEQEIPHKLQELIRLKNLVKENKLKRRRKKKKIHDCIIVKNDKEKLQEGMTNPVKYIPDKMKQRENETEEHFIWRIDQLARQSLAESEMDQKYGVDILECNDGKLKRKQLKRKLAEQQRKEKKLMKIESKKDDFAQFTDDIKFGEVVTEPPKLILSTKTNKLKGEQKNILKNASLLVL